MREILYDDIKNKISEVCLKIGCEMNTDVYDALQNAYNVETEDKTRFALEIMLKNAKIAKETASPLCQDTGMTVVFIKIGQNVTVSGGFLGDAINEGVRKAYKDGYFRKSVLDPITRVNTKDNTPCIIHYELVSDDVFEASVLFKGFGSENMSKLYMLTPAAGVDGIKDVILDCVKTAGGNPCPPVIVGIGIGGTMEKAAIMSKHALLREIGSKNPDDYLNDMEKELTEKINTLGIGAQGFGGEISALGVFMEKFPTHLAGLPVAITIQCHAVRHGAFYL